MALAELVTDAGEQQPREQGGNQPPAAAAWYCGSGRRGSYGFRRGRFWSGGLGSGGFWNGGFWNGGFWNGGFWNDGFWNDGFWNDGLWNDGLWNDGLWNDRLWNDRLWNDGCRRRDGGQSGGQAFGGIGADDFLPAFRTRTLDARGSGRDSKNRPAGRAVEAHRRRACWIGEHDRRLGVRSLGSRRRNGGPAAGAG
jgi:hypothetical protein